MQEGPSVACAPGGLGGRSVEQATNHRVQLSGFYIQALLEQRAHQIPRLDDARAPGVYRREAQRLLVA